MNAIPFRIESAYGMFGECTGLLRDEGTYLSLEFESTLFWYFRTGIRTVKIPTSDVADVTFSKGLVNATIVIQASRLETLRDVPGSNQGRVELKIARRHRISAQQFVSGLYSTGGGANN
jgi:hypothetical protein